MTGSPHKILMVICDGMADLPLNNLEGRTPLEIANTPTLDFLARKGRCGLLIHDKSNAPSTVDVVSEIFGLDKNEIPGRGALEAVGLDISHPFAKSHTVVFRTNLAEVKGNYILWSPGYSAHAVESKCLYEEILKAIEEKYLSFEFPLMLRYVSGAKGLLFVSTRENPAPELLHYNPYSIKGTTLPIKSTSKLASFVIDFVHKTMRILSAHPFNKVRISMGQPLLNAIVPWGPGVLPCDIPTLSPYIKKLRIVGISSAGAFLGLLKLMGAKSIRVKREELINLSDKILKILNSGVDYDLVIIHIEGADEASHIGDPYVKIAIIEEIDSFIRALVELLMNKKTTFVIFSDHISSTYHRCHIKGPTPLLIYGAYVGEDSVSKFDEKNCLKGSLRISTKDLLHFILKRRKEV